jgi:hypothetical protein
MLKYYLRARSIPVVRAHGMGEKGAQFPPGPLINMTEVPKEKPKKEEFPKIKPPSANDVLSAKLQHAAEDPNIQKLMRQGKGILINPDTGELTIIEENTEDKGKKDN